VTTGTDEEKVASLKAKSGDSILNYDLNRFFYPGAFSMSVIE
jgi:hypothetical protein